MDELKRNIQLRMEKEKSNTSGKTSGSLTVQANEFGGMLFGSTVFLYLRNGRGPGAVPKDFNGIIKEWILSKGINYNGFVGKSGGQMSSDMKLQGLAGAIAHSIMTKGTIIYRKGVTKDNYDKALEDTIGRISDRVGEAMAIDIDTINKNFKKNEDNK